MAYSEDRKAEVLAVLAANGGNLRKTSRDTGTPLTTLREWRDAPLPFSCAEKRTEKKRDLAAALEDIAWKAAGFLAEKLAGASVHELNGTLKISTETMRLLREQPTAITESRELDLTPDAMARRVAAVLAGEDGRGAGPAHPGAARGEAGGALPADVPTVH